MKLPSLIWNFALIGACDHGFQWDRIGGWLGQEPTFDPQLYGEMKAGDVVYLKCTHVSQFCEAVLPRVRQRIVIVVADGDESFPRDCDRQHDVEKLLNNEFVAYVFAQNKDSDSTKIGHIPIGIDFHTVAYRGGGWEEPAMNPTEQESQLLSIANSANKDRKLGAFADFHHSNTMRCYLRRFLQFGEDRVAIFDKVNATGLVDHGARMRRSDLWKKKSEYAFSICPHGNGLDTHRTWEDLALGCIVVVRTSPLDGLYRDLPVVIVNDWEEFNRANLEKWYSAYSPTVGSEVARTKLTTNYWVNIIREKAQSLK